MTTAVEQQLLDGLRQGNPQAVQQWYREFGPRLQRFVQTKLANPADVDEIVQETFINCLRHLPLFRQESGIWSWMCSIAKHEVADYYRKLYAKRAIRALPLHDLLEDVKVEDAHHTAERVKQALTGLKARKSELLLLKYVDGKSVAEIALEWRQSVKSIESELFRARREFRTLYDSLAAEYEVA